jgi:hypothetical protein
MSETVSLDLPNELAERARAIAAQTHRRLEDVLLEWWDRAATEIPIHMLSNDQVLALCDLQMSDEQQSERGELLACQREGTLDAAGRDRLDMLLTVYRRGMVHKAEAIKVAVERGLRPALS